MSDPAPQAISPTPAPARQAPVGDYDDSILSHLGMPFYYRHAPAMALRRTGFWLAFVGLILLITVDLLRMPYAHDTIIYRIRISLFDNFPIYTSFAEAGKSIFNQLFVFAIIFSGIIAPLFATFSLSSERMLGTMEFLRLSPMSTLSIVMGKMFAPAFPLHLLSAVLLILGLPLGVLSGLPLNDVCFTMLVIVLSAALMHALGAFFAIFTLAFRGFGAVFFLLLLGYILSAAPLTFTRAQGVTFFVFASPWGAMEQLFWHETNYWTPMYETMFAGYESAVTPYVVCAYGIAFTLLVWAASRKLDRPDRNALPYSGWLIFWAAVVATAFGSVPNYRNISNLPQGYVWQSAAVILFIGGLITCGLALLDHPHSRENELADECERASGRENAGTRRPWRLWHAVFVTALVFVTASILVGIVYHMSRLAGSGSNYNDFEWMPLLAVVAMVVALTFSFALLLATVAVGYASLPARAAIAAAGMAVFLFAAIAPMVSLGVCYGRWSESMSIAEQYYVKKEIIALAQTEPDATADYMKNRLQYMRGNPDYAVYLEDIASSSDVTARKEMYRDALRFYWHYHRQALLAYPVIFLALFTLLVLWRRRNYASLRREAIAAVGIPQPMPEQAGPTPELAGAV